MKPQNQKIQREHNRRLVLQTIRSHKLISRVSLSRIIGLEKSSVSNIVNELIERGVLREFDLAAASRVGGRRPVLLEIYKDFACFLGFEIQPHRSTAVLVNIVGDVVYKWSRENHDPKATFSKLVHQAFNAVHYDLGPLNKNVAGICVGLSGRIAHPSRTVTESVLFGMHDSDLSFLDGINPWRLPVAIENDAICCAWAQLGASYGPQERTDDFLVVFAQMVQGDALATDPGGVGIGTALVLDRRVHYGKTSSAGEFRSVNWRQGNASQFAAPSTDPAIVGNDNPEFRQLLSELLISISPVLLAVEVERVFFCGEASLWFPLISRIVAEDLADSALSVLGYADKLYPAPEPDSAVARGAALRFIEDLYYASESAAQDAVVTWQALLDRTENQ